MPDDNPRDLPALERARLEADRRYNDALTAADRAIVRPAALAAMPAAPHTAAPQLPAGWRGWFLRVVHQWLSPLFTEQHAFNARIVQELAASAARERDSAVAMERFQTALIVFLQQITAFVDTKVRALDGAVTLRMADQDRTIAALSEIGAQVQTLQRTVQLLKRQTAERAEAAENSNGTRQTVPGASRHASRGSQLATATSQMTDTTYVGFEDRFRGTDEQIREKQSAYLPIFAGASDVLDIGCGRGEFLALLNAQGVSARGIDVNGEMVAVARERGLDATAIDALGYVAAIGDESLGGVMCAQVVEHLEPSYLISLLETLSQKLRPEAPVVIETINPACWLAFFSSYIRDFTHVRPIHPNTLEYLLHAAGFGRVSIQFSAPVPDHVKMKSIALPGPLKSSTDVMAQALAGTADVVNANSAILNSLLFTYMDYAAVAYRS